MNGHKIDCSIAPLNPIKSWVGKDMQMIMGYECSECKEFFQFHTFFEIDRNLPTLRDLKWYYPSDGLDTDEDELKKKISGEILNVSTISIRDLRQLVINWIKHLKKERTQNIKDGNEQRKLWKDGAIEWSLYVFNITEADLK